MWNDIFELPNAVELKYIHSKEQKTYKQFGTTRRVFLEKLSALVVIRYFWSV